MYNRIILVGYLTRDVELRYLPSGSALAKMGMATSRRYKKQDGSNGEDVCFVDISLFGRTAEVANQYLKKGSKVLIEGRLVFESWVDQTGQKRSKHIVAADSLTMLDSKSSSQSFEAQQGQQNFEGHQQQYETMQKMQQIQNVPKQEKDFNKIPEIDVDDDDVPF